MAILALKGVARAMRKLHCSDEMMAAACAEIASGLTDADLGFKIYIKNVSLLKNEVNRAVCEQLLLVVSMGDGLFLQFGQRAILSIFLVINYDV
jgi:Uncharacterized protein conserved in bacteria